MKKSDFNINSGTLIKGKWNGRAYQVIRKLGTGACGTVYLCRSNTGDMHALKVGHDSSRMMLEVNMLKRFNKVQGVKLGPSFVDVDDWLGFNQEVYPFYVMEYIDGIPMQSFLQGKTKEWIGLCAVQLLTDLQHLHQAGYVFGDLKTDNLLFKKSRVCWIDVGGVTAMGRAVKEYTEFYDRGYWGNGSRRADPNYDLFAVTMIMMEMVYPKRFDKGSDPKKTLETKLSSSKMLRPYQHLIRQCWRGKYRSAEDMKKELSKMLMKRVNRSKSSKPSTSRTGKRTQQPSSEWGELTALSIFSIAFLGISIWSIWL